MRTLKDQVIILKSRNYQEADKILTVFGREHGKFSLLAKGMRKIASKNRGNMQTLSLSDISFYKAQGIPLLLESKAVYIPDFTQLNISNTQRVLYLLSQLLPDEQAYPKVYRALSSAIKGGLDSNLTNRFRTLLLTEEGLLDSLLQCKECGGSSNKKYLLLSSFVMVCENCYILNKWSKKDLIELEPSLYSKEIYSNALDHYVKNVLQNIV